MNTGNEITANITTNQGVGTTEAQAQYIRYVCSVTIKLKYSNFRKDCDFLEADILTEKSSKLQIYLK